MYYTNTVKAMNAILNQLGACIEFGKINKVSPYPPTMRDRRGLELTAKALSEGVTPNDILGVALIPAMGSVGGKFSEGKILVPQMLISAKAMSESMKQLRPYFQSGDIQRKGTFIVGTVAGDLHDIGKNLTGMMVEGAGWEVIDLGSDVSAQKLSMPSTVTPVLCAACRHC
jgi:5-methyltetrahydrofolate--homocysteine methyltransferase